MFTYSVEVGAREKIWSEVIIPSTKKFFFRVMAAVLLLATIY